MGELMARTNRTNTHFVLSVRTAHTTPFRGVRGVREFVCEFLSLEREIEMSVKSRDLGGKLASLRVALLRVVVFLRAVMPWA